MTRKGKPKGGTEYDAGKVIRILKSQVYLGKIEHNGEVYEGKHDPILDQEIYDKVQHIMANNRIRPKAYQTSNAPALLSSVAKCRLCSNALTTTNTQKNGKKYYYYKCLKKNEEGNTEDHAPKPLSVSALDDFVFKSFELLQDTPQLLRAAKKKTEFEGSSKMKKLDDQIDQLKEQLKSTKQEISKTKSFLTGNIGDRSKDILLDELENLALKKEEIEDEIKLCEKEKKHIARQTSINIPKDP